MESEREGSAENSSESSEESSEDSEVVEVISDGERAGPNRDSGKILTCKVAHYHAVIVISCVLLLTSAGKVHSINVCLIS